MPDDFVRVSAVMHVDLAYAHAANGDRNTTREYASQARRLANLVRSDRLLRRLSRLVLPT